MRVPMRAGARHLLFRHLPTLLWTGFMAVTLCAPLGTVAHWSDRISLPWVDPYLDKIVHFALFAVFAVLVSRSCAVLAPTGSSTGSAGRTGAGGLLARWPSLWALLSATIFGTVTELAQMRFASRSADWLDLVADVLGAASALTVAALRRGGS